MTAYNTHRPWGGGGTSAKVAGRIRADQRRLRNDAGWWAYDCVSDFGAVGHILRGRVAPMRQRYARYADCGRTVVRNLGMLGDESWVHRDLAFSPRDPGYWDAAHEAVLLANEFGMYSEFNIFADAQIVMSDAGERERTVDAFAAFCLAHPGVLPGLTNEPYKNGWSSVVDPALLALADRFALAVGHRDFSIGDVPDSGNGPEMAAACETVAHHCNILAWHANRDQLGDTTRYRRWLDHLEGFTELPTVSNQNAASIHQEPMGAFPTYIEGKRDNDPDAFVAAAFESRCIGYGFCNHWIPEEDGQMSVEQWPGMTPKIGALLAQVPVSPDWRYMNDGWPGSPTKGITWVGKTGKVRHLVRGNQAWSVAHGEADWNSVVWQPGWTPTVVYGGQRCHVWSVNL